MNVYRHKWMTNLVSRDLQPVDALLQTTLQQSIGFFASTSILAIGGLFAILGASEQALDLLGDFPLTVATIRLEHTPVQLCSDSDRRSAWPVGE